MAEFASDPSKEERKGDSAENVLDAKKPVPKK